MNSSAAEFSRCLDDRPWLFGRVPDGFWDIRDNRMCYLGWLGEHLGLAHEEDWYEVCNLDFTHNHGGTLLHRIYGSSVYIAMRDYHPQYNWIPWLFRKTHKGFWKKVENRKSYMEWLEEILGIGREEDWYQITIASFHDNRGSGLLRNHFHGSVLSALYEYHPNYDWKPWLFPKVPHGFWDQSGNRKRYLQWLAGRLQFRSLSDWRGLTKQDLAGTGGSGLFHRHYCGSFNRLRNEVVSMKLCKRT